MPPGFHGRCCPLQGSTADRNGPILSVVGRLPAGTGRCRVYLYFAITFSNPGSARVMVSSSTQKEIRK